MSVTKKKNVETLDLRGLTSMSNGSVMAQALIAMLQDGGLSEKEITTTTVEGNTEQIIIPKGMSKLDAAAELERQHEEEETEINLIQYFKGYMADDVFVAVKKTCEEMFGWVNAKARMTFFGPVLPQEIQVQIGLKDNTPIYESCFYGNFGITAWDSATATLGVNGNGPHVSVQVKKKFKSRVEELFASIEKYLKSNSIYKGKTLKFEDGNFVFIEALSSPHIILNSDENQVIDNFIIKKLGQNKGKSSMLFIGDYGTGKTETAIRIGAIASEEHNITFVYCKQADKFPELLNVMKNYQPAIIFLEDVDSIGSGEERDSRMNDLLNTLDGIETKGQALTTIFTTNHEKKINRALRRPGRIDLIVKFSHCNPETIEKIYRSFFKGLAGEEQLNYTQLAGVSPIIQGAVIAEIAKRAIDLANHTNAGVLTDDVVESAIVSMKFQIEFMAEDPENTISRNDAIVEGLVEAITESEEFGDLLEGTEAIRRAVGA